MLRGVRAASTTSDPQLLALLDHTFHRFDQWKTGSDVNGRSKVMRLRATLDHLLSRLLGARDFVGAAQVLSVLYHRFTLIPARCVQASLEILRRHPQCHKEELVHFYQTALRIGRLDRVMLYKEMLMLHIASGDYYDAYHLFKDEMQELDDHHDAHLQGMFGMVCYWLLFIESTELREKITQDAEARMTSDEESEQEYAWPPREQRHKREKSIRVKLSTAADWIESRYLYKAAVGVHILYQDAVGAFRRAISNSPDSAIYVEHYAQLLTLVGDTSLACDVLEHFYYTNPQDPHAARMLAGCLENYFPDSIDAQVDIYLRWIGNDPSSQFLLTKVLDLSTTGRIPPDRLLVPLAKAIDGFGSDLHLSRFPKAVTRLWKVFTDILCACQEASKHGCSESLAALNTVRSSRRWWIRAFFSRPSTPEDASLLISSETSFGEVLVLKALTGYLLYEDDVTILARTAHSLLQSNPTILSPMDAHTFRREISKKISTHLSPASLPQTPRFEERRPTNPSVSVLNRSLLIKNTTHASGSIVEVARIDNEAFTVDQELIAALEEAVRTELGDGQGRNQLGKRSFEAMINGLVSCNGESSLTVPVYVDALEELLYKHTKAWSPHLQVQLNSRLRDTGATIPTWLEVKEAFRFFQERWISNESHYGHPGLLLRYEVFLVRYMRKRAKSSQYWVASVSPSDVRDALREMRLRVSRSHVHFPEFDEAAKWMRIKASRFLRTRRRLLRHYMLAMRYVAYEASEHVETRDLVYAAMRVAAQNSHSDLLAVEDLQRQAKIVLVNRYAHVVRHMWTAYRQFFESYVRAGRIYDPLEVLAALKRRYARMKRMSLQEVKAFLWLKRWEAENPGRYRDLIEDVQTEQ